MIITVLHYVALSYAQMHITNRNFGWTSTLVSPPYFCFRGGKGTFGPPIRLFRQLIFMTFNKRIRLDSFVYSHLMYKNYEN